MGKCEDPAGYPAGSSQSVSGCVLLSHTVTSAVPSALKGLASGFGMEAGRFPFAMAAVTLWRCHRFSLWGPDRISGTAQWTRTRLGLWVCIKLSAY